MSRSRIATEARWSHRSGRKSMLQPIPTGMWVINMETDLATIFAEQQTNRIDWCGGPLYSLYELPTDSSEMRIRFVAFRACPPQGFA